MDFNVNEIVSQDKAIISDASVSFLNKVKKSFTKSTVTDEILPANQQYLLTKYGNAESDTVRVTNFFKDINSLISYKRSEPEYACVRAIPDDLYPYIDAIIDQYKSAGYIVKDLYDCIPGLVEHYLFICWNIFEKPQKSYTEEK